MSYYSPGTVYVYELRLGLDRHGSQRSTNMAEVYSGTEAAI